MKNFKLHLTTVAVTTLSMTSSFAADNGLILFGNANNNVKETTALETAAIAASSAVGSAVTNVKSSIFKENDKYTKALPFLLDDDLLFKKHVPDLQKTLNEVVRSRFTDSQGNIVCDYYVNKAQAWLDMTKRSQNLVTNVNPATYHAFEQAYKLTHMLKDGINPLPKDTPLVKHTSEVRIDLKQQLKNIATSNACDCAKAQIGIAEVYLVDAARYHHEDRRRDETQRLEREAERVIDNIQETDKQCVATAEAARLAKIEAERQEAERLAKIEADRLAKIEADRLAKIEADRIAAEQAALAAVQVAVAPAPEVIPVQQVSFGTDALFKFNGGSSKDLTADGLLKLEDFVTKLNEVKNVERLLVEGHADRFGRDPYNEGLSSQRANTIAAFLVSKGVNAQMIQVQGYGESRPLVECAGKKSKKVIECLQPNRRVELKVFGTK